MTDFKSAVAEVKLAYNIVEYIQSAGVRLRQAGTNNYKGLCPFHNEKSPSFTVDEHFQNYKCFGCGVSGDILKFVQGYEHLEFFDALKKLAEDKNIKLDIKEERSGVDYSSLREAMRTVSNFFFSEYRKLPPEHPARIEVTKRGLSEKKVLYGYAPEGRQVLYKHLKEKGFSDDVILLTGACVQYEGKTDINDFWNGRLMFFFTDISGKSLGWSGRKLYETDKRGKYVNSKEGVLFDKSSVLYNLAKAKKMAAETKTVYVAEGQFDVAAFVEADLLNSVASSGTAFTEKQAMILRRLVGEDGRIVFCFDGDKAGVQAAERVFKNIPGIHSQAYVVTLPEGEDPDTYRKSKGNEALVSYVETHAVPIVEFVLGTAAAGFDLHDDIGKTKYIGHAARILRTISSLVLRETYTKKVSLDSFTSIEVVRQAIQDAQPLVADMPRAATPDSDEPELEVPPVPEEDMTEEQLAERSLEDLKDLVREDEMYGLSARMLALALSESTLVDPLLEKAPVLPQEFKTVSEELAALPKGEPLIAEKFTATDFVDFLITTEFFPFSHLMDSEIKVKQFSYLADRLDTLIKLKQERYVRAKVAQVLKKSPNQGAAFLEKALEAEARGLQDVSARP